MIGTLRAMTARGGDQLVALSFQYVDVEAFEKAKRDELD